MRTDAEHDAPREIPRRPELPWFLRSSGRLLVTLLVVVGLPLGGFTWGVLASARSTLRAQAERQNMAAARLGAEAVQSHFEGLSRYVESYARRPDLVYALEAGEEQAVRSHLADLVGGNDRLGRAFITNAEGVELYDHPSAPEVIGQSFAYRDWYRGVTRTGKTYVSEIYRRAAAPRVDSVAVATPILGRNARTLGFLVAQHSIDTLVGRLDQIRPADVGSIVLIDPQDHLAARRTNLEEDPKPFSTDATVRRMRTGAEGGFEGPDPRNDELCLISYSHPPSFQWTLAALQPVTAVYAPIRTLQSSVLALSMLCLLGMLLLGFSWLSVVRRHHVALLELQRQKELLSGMIIHDLRSPLTATVLSIDLARAREEGVDPALREDLARASHSAHRLRELVNLLLDVMRMEEGALQPSLVRQDLAQLVRSKVAEHQPLAEAASLVLAGGIPDRPVEARIDTSLVGRVLDNLIVNAVKHTPQGGRVEVRLETEARGVAALISVSDTGEGIPSEALPNLFQKFGRVAGQKLGRPDDVGLGLAFCRMAVELHGGKIQAQSEPGKGSVFRVRLPLSPS